MDIMQILSCDNVKKVIIEKENITASEYTSENEKKINMNISVHIIYDNGKAETSTAETTVGDYIKNWLYAIKANELKPSSFDRIEQTVNYQILPYIGNISLIKLKSDDIQNMINALKNKYSYSTIKKAYEGINSCLK